MGLIPDSDFFFVPRSCHVDQFTFHNIFVLFRSIIKLEKWKNDAFLLVSLNTVMQKTANENAVGLQRICYRSDQPNIEKLENNNARLILSIKRNGTTT